MDALKNIREFASFCGNITGNNHQKKRVKNIFCSSLKILQELAKPLSERRFFLKKYVHLKDDLGRRHSIAGESEGFKRLWATEVF